jgi:hypothetical protein
MTTIILQTVADAAVRQAAEEIVAIGHRMVRTALETEARHASERDAAMERLRELCKPIREFWQTLLDPIPEHVMRNALDFRTTFAEHADAHERMAEVEYQAHLRELARDLDDFRRKQNRADDAEKKKPE